jgi:hypothetical protein
VLSILPWWTHLITLWQTKTAGSKKLPNHLRHSITQDLEVYSCGLSFPHVPTKGNYGFFESSRYAEIIQSRPWHVFQKNLGAYQELSLDMKSDYNKEHWVECSPGWNCIPFTIFAPNSKHLWTSWQSPSNVITKGQILLCIKHVGKSCLDSLQLHTSKSYFDPANRNFLLTFYWQKRVQSVITQIQNMPKL